MNKLGIWAIVIVAAFVVGILSANPVAEAVPVGIGLVLRRKF